MKYFVTGATGLVGGELVRQLRKANHEVVALVRNPNQSQKLLDLGITVAKGDITDKESMRAPMQGCDGVFHLAAWYKIGARDKKVAWSINVDGTLNVLEMMQELRIPKGVYTSTLAVNSDTKGVEADENYHFTGKHISEYDRTKAAAHDAALDFIKNGLPLVILMPGLIYGPEGQSMSDLALKDYLRQRLPMAPTVAAYSWAHVEDVAAAHILAMDKAAPGSKYIICGPSHTFFEALQIAKSITGKRLPMPVPPFMLKMSSYLAASVEWLIPLPEMYSSEAMWVQAGRTYLGNNSKAKQELGYQPRPLREGLEQTFAAWKGKIW